MSFPDYRFEEIKNSEEKTAENEKDDEEKTGEEENAWDSEEEQLEREGGLAWNRWHEAWNRLRGNAGRAALSLGGLAVTIFCSATVAGIAEGNNLLWITSLSVVSLLLVTALVASCFAFQDLLRRPHESGDNSQVV